MAGPWRAGYAVVVPESQLGEARDLAGPDATDVTPRWSRGRVPVLLFLLLPTLLVLALAIAAARR